MFAGSITDAKFVQDKQHRKVILEMYTYVLYPAAVSVYYHVNNKKNTMRQIIIVLCTSTYFDPLIIQLYRVCAF